MFGLQSVEITVQQYEIAYVNTYDCDWQMEKAIEAVQWSVWHRRRKRQTFLFFLFPVGAE